jgi:plastocyanin
VKRSCFRGAIAAAAIVALVAPLPARAATYPVEVQRFRFAPDFRILQPGDTVVWKWIDGIHNLTSYEGAEIDTGDRSPSYQYRLEYNGGTIRYRCTIDSQLNGSGQCSGMCGVVSDQDLDLTPPAARIDAPANGEVVHPLPVVNAGGVLPVTIRGAAYDDRAVFDVGITLYDTAGRPRRFVPQCLGCGTSSATWSLQLSLLPGSYVAEATATDTGGNATMQKPRVAFYAA